MRSGRPWQRSAPPPAPALERRGRRLGGWRAACALACLGLLASTPRARGATPPPATGTALPAPGAAPATSAPGERAAGALAALATGTAPAPSPTRAPRADAPLPDEPPGDPNDRVLPMDPPLGQPRHTDRRRLSRSLAVDSATRRRLQLTIMPAYAAVVLSFVGRSRGLRHGGGVMGELDVGLWRYLWLRVTASYTAHGLPEETAKDDNDEVKVTAPAGLLSVTSGTVGLAYALDFSRMLAMIDLGIGGARITTPKGVTAGQRGQPCQAGGGCDPGLACNGIGICEPVAVPTLVGGLSAEWLLGRHFSLGATVRYHAFLSQPGVFPIYLLTMLRAGLRF